MDGRGIAEQVGAVAEHGNDRALGRASLAPSAAPAPQPRPDAELDPK